MIGGVLQNLLGGTPSQSESPPEPEATSHSFDSIDQYKAGLAERLRRYLSTGQEPEVLGDVAKAVAQKPANRLFYKIVNEVRAEAHGCGGDNELSWPRKPVPLLWPREGTLNGEETVFG